MNEKVEGASTPAVRSYEVELASPAGGGPFRLKISTGQSVVIVGSNGSGKTRLGALLDERLGKSAHRIAAHKSLAMSDGLRLMPVDHAEGLHRYGNETGGENTKLAFRWRGKPAIHMLSDFEPLLLRLFGEHARVAVHYLTERESNPSAPPPTTKLKELKKLWDGLLPHRRLLLEEAAVKVVPTVPTGSVPYAASEMSDGERAIFYFLGQCLLAPTGGVIIIDEPEGHVHKAILGRLWDAIERARPDCAFVYITHDVDFAAGRACASKYFVRSYVHPDSWDIDILPDDTGLPEDIVAELVGSRKPILFTEGNRGSIDQAIYSAQYADFTLMPVGSCDNVVRSVASLNANGKLHWIKARGLVDADDRSAVDIANLNSAKVYVLPVSEVENLLLLPDVFQELAKLLQCADPSVRLAKLTEEVLKLASAHKDLISARHATRQLDRHLKRVTVAATDQTTLVNGYATEIAAIDPATIFNDFKTKLEQAIASKDLPKVLALYDNKGLLATGAIVLGIAGPKELMERVTRLLGGDDGAKLRAELTKVLPKIPS